MKPTTFKSFLAEFIGTYVLVFSGTSAIVVNDITRGLITQAGIALTFGLAVGIMIYLFREISGAHINPAVTIALWYGKQFPRKKVFPYVTSQLIGAVAASGTLSFLFLDHPTLGATLPRGSEIESFVLEVLLSLILIFTICVLTSSPHQKKGWAGLMIGGVVALEAFLGGPISGASMNPARSIGPALVSGHLRPLWIYIFAPITGAFLAVIGCRSLKEKECCQ